MNAVGWVAAALVVVPTLVFGTMFAAGLLLNQEEERKRKERQ